MVRDLIYPKVVWFEGMTLDPQHFQQADRFHQAALNFRLRTRARHDWGFTELQVNQEALANGQFDLLKCKGVMPDGLAFDMPATDRLPTARALVEPFERLAVTAERKLEVYLTIRSERTTGGNCELEASSNFHDSRFSLEQKRDAPDDNLRGSLKQIGVARTNFQFRLSGEPLDDFSALKVAEVKSSGGRGFELMQTFIPPCLAIGAADSLMAALRDLLGELARRSLEEHRQFSFGKAAFTTNELAGFWLSHTLNTYIPLLNHHYHSAKCHPEELFTHWLTLAGQLTSFPSEVAIRPTDFSRYDHDNLTGCFSGLKKQIQALLDGIRPTTVYRLIKLENTQETFWQSETIDDKLLQLAQIFLGVKGNLPEDKIVKDLPSRIKIGTPNTIQDELIAHSLPGLPINYVPQPPVALPASGGEQYFRLGKDEKNWEAIIRERAIMIFMPLEFAALTPRLLALTE